MISQMFNTVAGKVIAIYGFAFKADTGDTRESPAICISRQLVEERAEVVISDPQALENAEHDLSDIMDRIRLEKDPYEAARGAHAVAVLTEWDLYAELDFERVFEVMMKPAFIFDGRNCLDHKKLFDIGFNVFAVGKAALSHL